VYEVNSDDVNAHLADLPIGALRAFAELRTTLEVAPTRPSSSAGHHIVPFGRRVHGARVSFGW
jgi:hypothetical protein